jgi:hypothetical protein
MKSLTMRDGRLQVTGFGEFLAISKSPFYLEFCSGRSASHPLLCFGCLFFPSAVQFDLFPLQPFRVSLVCALAELTPARIPVVCPVEGKSNPRRREPENKVLEWAKIPSTTGPASSI